MEHDDREFRKRINELANRAYKENRYIFTDFLNPSQLSVVKEMEKDLRFVGFRISGGLEETETERAVVRFGNEELTGYVEEFPIVLIRISPRMKKFADELGHRDFLGAVMNLGIERDTIGDILIRDNTAYMFVMERVAEYILDQLISIKHTSIRAEICDTIPEEIKPKRERRDIIVSSNRIDAIIAKLYNLSREQSLVLFREGKVFVNGREMTSNARPLKENEAVAVRGFGKFCFISEGGKTKKDRLYVAVEVYV